MKKDVGMADYEKQEFHTLTLQCNFLFFGVKKCFDCTCSPKFCYKNIFLKINTHAHTHVENAKGLTQKTEYLRATATNCH